MAAVVWNITVEQGATFRRVLTWTNDVGAPINLTSYTARMQARTRPGAPNTEKIFELTTENGGIVLGGIAGTITLQLSAAATAALIADWVGVYDLELVSSGGEVTRLAQGRLCVSAEVTK